MPDRFEDERGFIWDLPIRGPIDAVTRIFTKAGAIRGNHVHALTTQWAYVVRGHLLVVSQSPQEKAEKGVRKRVYGAGEVLCDEPGTAHAWQALEDTEVLVFTRGPRSGEAYESDTQRLTVPLLP